MFKIIAITNRKLCEREFLAQIESIAKTDISAIILREKDLNSCEYKKLAQEVLLLCKKNHTACILNSQIEVARELGEKKIHLPMPFLRINKEKLQDFTTIGASIHSVEEAKEAETLGATYVTAGHIFKTHCKKGLPPRGIEFLKEVVESVSIPVYAIGGIQESNVELIRKAQAAGACIMSSFMKEKEPERLLDKLK